MACYLGFPCNDFSLVGQHKGMGGEFGPLYSYGVKVLERHVDLYKRPKWFLAENVGVKLRAPMLS